MGQGASKWVRGECGCGYCSTEACSWAAGATSVTSCIDCGAGKNSAAGASACVDCGEGKYSVAERATVCVDCGAGTYINVTGGATCLECSRNPCPFSGTFELFSFTALSGCALVWEGRLRAKIGNGLFSVSLSVSTMSFEISRHCPSSQSRTPSCYSGCPWVVSCAS